MAHCSICDKTTKFGNWLSRSNLRARRKMRPNLQKVGGLVLCTRCLRTVRTQMKKQAELKIARAAEATPPTAPAAPVTTPTPTPVASKP